MGPIHSILPSPLRRAFFVRQKGKIKYYNARQVIELRHNLYYKGDADSQSETLRPMPTYPEVPLNLMVLTLSSHA